MKKIRRWTHAFLARTKPGRKLPSSWDEKMERKAVERFLFVHELKAILDQLDPTDAIEANAVGNLHVTNLEGTGIGYIDLFEGKYVEFDKE